MSLGAVAVLAISALGAIALVAPTSRRSGLGIWHPAMAWLAAHLLFFAVGSAILAVVDDTPGPALYVAAAMLAFGGAVRISGVVAGRRNHAAGPPSDPDRSAAPPSFDGLRASRVVAMAGLGGLLLLPTLLSVGIPALVPDVTGARAEVGGIDLQVLRVTLPAAVLVAILAGRVGGPGTRIPALAIVAAAVVAELALASRYLAAELVVAAVIALGLARQPVPPRALAALAAGAAVLFVGVGILRAFDQAAGHELAFGVERTVNRVLLIEPRTLRALQEVIPAETPYFDGRTWLRRLAPFVGRDDVPNLGYWIYPRLFPTQVTPGYAAPGLPGEAWANFGSLGIALFGALGVAVERLGALIARRRGLVVDVIAGALLTLFVARTHALGLNGLVILVAIVAAWRALAAPIAGLIEDLQRTVTWRI